MFLFFWGITNSLMNALGINNSKICRWSGISLALPAILRVNSSLEIPYCSITCGITRRDQTHNWTYSVLLLGDPWDSLMRLGYHHWWNYLPLIWPWQHLHLTVSPYSLFYFPYKVPSVNLTLIYHPPFIWTQMSSFLEPLGLSFSAFKLHGTQHQINLVTKNTQYCKVRLTVFLSTFNNFKLVNLMVYRELVKFSITSAEVWINMKGKWTRASRPSRSARLGSIWSKPIGFYTIKKPPV